MANPFDYVNSIMTSKANMMRGTENDALAEKDYNAWLTNVALSYHQDTILLANLTNSLHHLPNRAQYEILLNTVRSKKRPFTKWAKEIKSDDLDLVCETYSCSKTRAKEYLTLLTTEQLESLREQRQTGGTKK